MNREIEAEFDKNFERYLSEWKEFLKFPSISMEPEHADNCLRCASWLSSHLESIGFSSRIIETSSHPLVFAEYAGDPSAPTVLYYGHYDVQPVDPLNAWVTPPFEPNIRNNRMFARGAQDNKGQIFYSLKALEELIRLGQLKPTIKVLIEGDEEFGSKGIMDVLPQIKEELKADALLVADTATASSGAPTIIMGLRGIIHMSLKLNGPDHDLHSGAHGGAALNPATEICRLLAKLHDDNGRIAIDGFYDDVNEPSEKEKELANADFDEERYFAQTGMRPLSGEKDYTPVERICFRPSIDVNGISGGYNGPGIKTVIPDHANARISARLVPGQDPAKCYGMIADHLRRNTPEGMTLEIPEHLEAGGALRVDPDSRFIERAKSVLSELSDKDVVLQWDGASIPIVASLAQTSGAEPLLVGFGSAEDNVHAPNESFSLDRFKQGFMYIASMLCSLDGRNSVRHAG